MLPQLPEPVAFEEVAAILDEAALQARGGLPYVNGAAGWHLASALNAAGFHVVRAPADARQLTLLRPPMRAPQAPKMTNHIRMWYRLNARVDRFAVKES